MLDFAYPQGTNPGEYRFTPPFTFAFAPGWAEVTPFVLRDASQFRADPPYTVTDRQYTKDFNEIKRLGGDDITTPSNRSAEQTEVALFWVESSPLQWNRIARTVSAEEGLNPWQNARLWPPQHGHGRWLRRLLRDQVPLQLLAPHNGDPDGRYDGNPNTEADPTWTPW